MHLFSLSNCATRYGIDLTVDDFKDALTRASIAATQDVASRFRFDGFDAYTARRDVFYVDTTRGIGNGYQTQLLLSRGFATAATLTARYTSSPVHARNNDTTLLTDLQNVAQDGQSNMLGINAEQGLLTTFNLDLTDLWVVVEYEGGFTVAANGEYLGVPAWLSEAAMAQTAINLSQNVMLQADGEDGDFDQLRGALRDLTARHGRFHLAANHPSFTEAVTTVPSL